jgi:hypothetical protein
MLRAAVCAIRYGDAERCYLRCRPPMPRFDAISMPYCQIFSTLAFAADAFHFRHFRYADAAFVYFASAATPAASHAAADFMPMALLIAPFAAQPPPPMPPPPMLIVFAAAIVFRHALLPHYYGRLRIFALSFHECHYFARCRLRHAAEDPETPCCHASARCHAQSQLRFSLISPPPLFADEARAPAPVVDCHY